MKESLSELPESYLDSLDRTEEIHLNFFVFKIKFYNNEKIITSCLPDVFHNTSFLLNRYHLDRSG